MLAKIRNLLVFILLGVIATPYGMAQDELAIPALDRQYVDDRNGFSMPYPEGWLVQQQVVGQTLYVVATPGHVFDLDAGPPKPGEPVAIIDFGSYTKLAGEATTFLEINTKPIRVLQNYLGPEVPNNLPIVNTFEKAMAVYTVRNDRAGFTMLGIAVMLDEDNYVMATLYKAVDSDSDFITTIMTMMASTIPGNSDTPQTLPTLTPLSADSGTYSTPDLKYSFDYPTVWKPEITYDNENGISTLQATILGMPFLMNSMIIQDPGQTPTNYLAPSGPWLQNNEVELIESEEFEISGLNGAMITYTTEESGPVPITVYTLDLDNGYFVLSLTRGGPMDNPLFQVTVKTVLQSFVVGGAKPTTVLVPTATPMEQAVDRDAARAAFNEGLTLSNERDYGGAIEPYTRAIEIDPEYKSAYFRRGEAYFILEEYDKAIADLDQAIVLDPEYHEAYNQRGRVYESLRNYGAAIADYTQAISMYRGRGNPITYLNNRGVAYRSLGDFDRAIEDFDKAIELNPNTTYTYANRGITYRMMGEDLGQALMDLRLYNNSLNTPNVRISEIIAELEGQLGLEPGELLDEEIAIAVAKPLLGVDRDALITANATIIPIPEIALLGRWDGPNKDAALMMPQDWIVGRSGNTFTAASSEELIKYNVFTSLEPGQFWITARRISATAIYDVANLGGTLGEILTELINNESDPEFIPSPDIVSEITEIVIADKPYGMARFAGNGYEGVMLLASWRMTETMRGYKGIVMVTASGEFSEMEETFYAVAGSYGLPEDVRINPETLPTFTLDVDPLVGQTWQILKNFKDEPVPYPIAFQYPANWVSDNSLSLKFAPNDEILALDYFENSLDEGQVVITVSQVAARIAIYPGESPVQYMVRQGRADLISHIKVNGEETARGRSIMDNGNLKLELMRSTHDGVLVVVTGYMSVYEEARWEPLLYEMLMSVEPISN